MQTSEPILLVEDDPNLGYILSEYLAIKGFVVTWAKDGKEALTQVRTNPFALIILDVMLPEMDGFSVAEKMQASGQHIPFIFLTAKQLKVDKLKGFTLGADDYITKPVDEEELVARIKAVLKRVAAPKERTGEESTRIGSSMFYVDRQVLLRNDTEYKLTARETAMLQLLIKYKNTLLNRDIALKNIWGSNDYFNRRSMDVLMSRLRKHLADDQKLNIINIHGKGYLLEEKTAD
jgi:DNA-binding response OmpR family regulator